MFGEILLLSSSSYHVVKQKMETESPLTSTVNG